MKPHTKAYFKAFGYDVSSWVPCEVSIIEKDFCKGNGTAVDIHHVEARGMGGSKDANAVNNLMGLCRECHLFYGDKAQFMDFLQVTHRKFMLKNIK
jgi:hypothetical protein